jgi:nucleoside-diphosphate kinase
MTNKTLSMIKPDATERNVTGGINKMIEDAGFRIIAQKRLCMSEKQASAFYAVHQHQPWFSEMVADMTAPVVVQVLEKDNAVADYRKLMGATNPEAADRDTIRKVYGVSIGQNSVHGSDSEENAAREIGFFFSEIELVG